MSEPETQPQSAERPPGRGAVLVTGATRGIGRAIALRLAAEGWDVAASYRSAPELADEVCGAIEERGRRAVALRAELESAEECGALVEAAAEALGGLGALVANAGAMAPAPLLEARAEDADRQYFLNARAPLLLAQAAAERMREGGAMVFVTSRAAGRAVPGLAGYCMSKAALKMLTEVAALELAPRGIVVNAVAPATTETDLNRELLADDAYRARVLDAIPLGRLTTPEDVAAAVAFLLSEEARQITGATLPVDGGAAL
jgi:NAD(P)-dependent dehydrogenase (short-subunit alcohol dehydrogenase family)